MRFTGLRLHIRGARTRLLKGLGSLCVTGPGKKQGVTPAHLAWLAAPLLFAVLPGPAVAGSAESSGPSMSTGIESTSPKVTCPQGGALYFRVGSHLIRVEADRWELGIHEIENGPKAPHGQTLVACRSANANLRSADRSGCLTPDPSTCVTCARVSGRTSHLASEVPIGLGAARPPQ